MAFITVAGENKIAYQQGNSLVLNVTHFVLAFIDGLGAEPVDRIEALPDPGDIVDTRAVTKSAYVNTNQVVFSLSLDSSIGDYIFNWVGIKDEDDVLIAVIYLADPITKTANAGGFDGNNLVRNFLLAYSGIAATAAIAAPAETWQTDFTPRLLGLDERERLSNYDLYGHDAFIDDGWLAVRDGVTDTYDISVGTAYVGGIRINSDVVQPVVAAVSTSIWVDVSLQGDVSGMVVVVDFIADAAAHVDYTDVLGFDHYVVKIADVAGDGSVSDLRSISTTLKTKVIAIGDWNMDTTSTVSVAHGLTFSQIISVSAFIIDDFSSVKVDIHTQNGLGTGGENGLRASASFIYLYRETAGYFDSAVYDSTPFNRGWINIQYTD